MKQLRIPIVLGLLAGFALSPRLWLNTRLYPLTPVGRFPVFPAPADGILFGALLAMLVVLLAAPRRGIVAGVFAVFALLALQDQSRWQPWFYQYALMLLAIALAGPGREAAAANTCRLIVVATYVWSGLSKCNPAFLGDTFPWLVAPLVRGWPAAAQAQVDHLAALAPMVEVLTGLALLSRRFRRAGVLLAAGIHGFVLLALGPLGLNFNRVVWPWNLAMMTLVLLLFGRPARDTGPRDIVWGKGFGFQKVVLVAFGLAPALCAFGLWDDYLSCALYSGNANSATIAFDGEAFARLPSGIRRYVVRNGPDEYELLLDAWSFGELHTPPYPEPRIFQSVGRAICRDTGDSPSVRLEVEGKLALRQSGREWEYGCRELR